MVVLESATPPPLPSETFPAITLSWITPVAAKTWIAPPSPAFVLAVRTLFRMSTVAMLTRMPPPLPALLTVKPSTVFLPPPRSIRIVGSVPPPWMVVTEGPAALSSVKVFPASTRFSR